MSMQGQSGYVYTKQMNQGSTGMSGSYGLSGAAKVSAAASAYFGSSSAQSNKSMKVSYQIVVRGGVENLSFDDLTPAGLMTSMAPGPRDLLSAALDAYINLNELLEKLPSDPTQQQPSLFKVLEHPGEYKSEYSLYEQWMAAVDDFRKNYGEGMVIKVAWGGIGLVTMDIANSSGESAMRYGGEASFSYESPGAALTVGATYDGNQSKGEAAVTVKCDQFSSGSPVEAQTTAWFNAVANHSFKELAEVKVLDKAPDMTAGAKVPNRPDFTEPKKDEPLVGKLAKIKDMEGLKLYAKAAAYDKAKKKNPNLTLEQFLKVAKEKAKVEPLKKMRKEVEEGDLGAAFQDLFGDGQGGGGGQDGAKELAGVEKLVNDAPTPDPGGGKPTTPAPGPFDGYTPIGVWIANWDHLFPWLATGFLNSIEDVKEIEPPLAYRAMLQDFLALGKLYHIADSCKFSPTLFPGAPDFVDVLGQIATSFDTRAEDLRKELEKKHKMLGMAQDPDFYRSTMRDAVLSLTKSARAIYKKWWDIGFLRRCELGLGVLGGETTAEENPGSWSPLIAQNGKSSVERLTGTLYHFSSSWFDKDWTRYAQDYGDPKSPENSRFFAVRRQKCLFEPDLPKPDYSVFANFYKLLPLLVPVGDEVKIYAFGPGNNVLGYLTTPPQFDRPSQENPHGNPQWEAFYNRNPGIRDSFVFVGDDGAREIEWAGRKGSFRFLPWDPVEFTPNAKSKTLEGRGLKLYPIPFSAAEGIAWKGQSFSTNLASMSDLRSTLEQLQDNLEKTNAWGFSSDGWPDRWDVSTAYHDRAIPRQYIGLFEQ
jgi:hypothetical protein